jgi:uncharacterized membrane protein
MKQSISLKMALAAGIACIPFAYLAITWASVPQTVAIHFDAQLKPDAYEDRSQLWVITGIITGVSFLVYLLLVNIHRIDPKRRNQPSATFGKLGLGLVVFMAVLSMLLVYAAAHGGVGLHRSLFPLLGLLFAFLGNYLPALKPNYFAGIRLPWTLNDPDNWRQTHRLAGRIWFWVGLAFTILALLLPLPVVLPAFITAIVIMVLIPGVYSYRLFRNKKAGADF